MADDKSKGDRTDIQPGVINLSPGEAAELMQDAVNIMRKQWLQTAVTLASALKNGQAVSRGTYQDLRHLRENYEELERARFVLQNVNSSAETTTGSGGSKVDDEGDAVIA